MRTAPARGRLTDETSGSSADPRHNSPEASPQENSHAKLHDCAERRDGAEHLDIADAPNAAATVVLAPAIRHVEREDAYPVIAQLNARWRVINCRDDMQWLLQKRQCEPWCGNSYHRDRDVLLQRIASRCGDVDAAALDMVRALPEWHP